MLCYQFSPSFLSIVVIFKVGFICDVCIFNCRLTKWRGVLDFKVRMQKRLVWIDSSFLNWYSLIGGGSYVEPTSLERAYDIWEHCRSLLVDNPTDFARSDAITNLKRCLYQRVTALEEVYFLEGIKLKESPKGSLEFLESLGLVRPFMLTHIREIRNDIEHRDASPPDFNRCQELLDLVWYFLKSTDTYMHLRRDDVGFEKLDSEENNTQYWLQISVEYELQHTLKVAGWLPSNMISANEQDGFFEIQVEKMESKADRWSNHEAHQDKLDTDIWLIGCFSDKPETKNEIVQKILSIRS